VSTTQSTTRPRWSRTRQSFTPTIQRWLDLPFLPAVVGLALLASGGWTCPSCRSACRCAPRAEDGSARCRNCPPRQEATAGPESGLSSLDGLPAAERSGFFRASVERAAQGLLRPGLAEETCPEASCQARVAEEANARAFLSAAASPQSLADAWQVFEQRKRAAKQKNGQEPQAGDLNQERAALDKALADLAADDLLAVQAQMAGMKAGASPDAYAAVFAELAGRRKDMEDRRGQVSRLLAGRNRATEDEEGKKAYNMASSDSVVFGPQWTAKALEEAALVLSAPDVPGETKRDIIGMVVEQVVCRKDGADVHFLPGFGLPRSGSSVADTLHSVRRFTLKTSRTRVASGRRQSNWTRHFNAGCSHRAGKLAQGCFLSSSLKNSSSLLITARARIFVAALLRMPKARRVPTGVAS